MKSPPYAREGRTCCDRLRGSLRSGDILPREGRAPARPKTAWGQRTRGSASLPLPIRGGRDKRDPPPVPCTTARAHPSCDRLRGSLRSGDMSPLWIRNRVAVATSATLPPCHARRRGRTPLATACAAHFVRGMCRHYQLPSTNYQPNAIANRKSKNRKSLNAIVNRKSKNRK